MKHQLKKLSLMLLSTSLTCGLGFGQTKQADIVYNFTDSAISVTPNVNNLITLVKTSNDIIIVAGQDSSLANKELAFTAGFDLSGNLLWKKFLPLTSGKNSMHLAEEKGLIQLADGNFAVAGVSRTNFGNDTASTPFIYIFNPQNGDSIHFQSINELEVWKLDALTFDAQGNFIIAGINQKTISGPFTNNWQSGAKLWTAGLNNNLQVQFYKQTDPAQNPRTAGGRLLAVNNLFNTNQGIGIAVTFETLPDLQSSYGIYKTTKDSSTFASFTELAIHQNEWAALGGGTQIVKPRSVILPKEDNLGYEFIGAVTSMMDGSRGWYYSSTDTSGLPDWSKVFSIEEQPPFDSYVYDSNMMVKTNFTNKEPIRLQKAVDGNLLMLQNTTITREDANGGSIPGANATLLPFLMRTDNSGNIVWQDTLRHTPIDIQNIDQSLIAMDITPDGHLILGGFVRADSTLPDYNLNNPGRTSWLIVLNDSVHTGAPTGINHQLPTEIGSKIKIYPNPATTEIWLSAGDLKIKNLTLFDVSGRQIQTFAPTARHLKITGLSSGIFYLRIDTEKGWAIKPLLIK